MSNRDRIFDEIVAVEGWHSACDDEDKSRLHVDLTFRKGRIGEDPKSKVRFEITLTRAEVFFSHSPSEGISVIQSSVAREIIPSGTAIKNHSTSSTIKGRAGASVSPAGLIAAASVQGEAQSEKNRETSIIADIRPIMSRQFRRSDGCYGWELSSAEVGASLGGKPWDPKSEPRLDFRKKHKSKIPPVAHIQVLCRREDLKLSSIELKERKSPIDNFAKNRNAAAEAVLKSLLSEKI